MIIFTWILTALSMIGVVLNARKKVSGFYFWWFANVGWVAINLRNEQWAQAVLFGFYAVACLYGILKWEKRL